MNSYPKKMMIGSAIVILVISSTGCGVQPQTDRQVIDGNNKQITVLDGPVPGTDQTVAVEQLQKVPGIRGMDWLDGDTILATKANTERMPQVIEGKERYPVNLVSYTLTDGSETVLQPADEDQHAGMLSPDKRFLFYKVMEESIGFGYLRHMETGDILPVTERQTPDELIEGYEGEWLDSEHVLFPTMSGKIYTADIEGHTEMLADTGDLTVHDVHKIGDRLYYIGSGQQLYIQEGEEPARLLMEQVIWVIPSPDHQSLAMVRRTREGEMTLYLTDLDGKDKAVLSKGMQIFGTAWSRDGTRLAYNLINAENGTSGLYVADAVTGNVTQVTVDLEDISNQLQWSPSGEYLMAATMIREADGYNPVTYIIKLRS